MKLIVKPFIVGLAFFTIVSSISTQPLAADRPYISVGAAHTKKAILAFPAIKLRNEVGNLREVAKSISDTVNNDLMFMDLFRLLDAKAFIEDAKTAGLTPETFKISNWTSIGAEFLIKTQLSREANSLILEAYLYDTFGNKQVLAKRYLAAPSESKILAHTLANDIVHALTGLPGIFLTKIAMSCDRQGHKEIYSMDFDGSNILQITHHKSTAISPAWSPDGTKIAYSVYVKNKSNIVNQDLFEFDFTRSAILKLWSKKGMNSGATYSPDGKKIALTMSFRGNPEIYSLDRATLKETRLSNSFGFDVDPSFSPDGTKVAFVSSRSGMPMVFSMNADGTKPQRLTYAGRYNASPSWSPQNNKIAFAGWLDKQFDIFMMNPDGSNIERLTKNQGDNEDPSFSPDGNFVIFSSDRVGGRNIYVMNIEGSYVKRLTYGLGSCSAPKWSLPLQPGPAKIPGQ